MRRVTRESQTSRPVIIRGPHLVDGKSRRGRLWMPSLTLRPSRILNVLFLLPNIRGGYQCFATMTLYAHPSGCTTKFSHGMRRAKDSYVTRPAATYGDKNEVCPFRAYRFLRASTTISVARSYSCRMRYMRCLLFAIIKAISDIVDSRPST